MAPLDEGRLLESDREVGASEAATVASGGRDRGPRKYPLMRGLMQSFQSASYGRNSSMPKE